MSDALKHMQQLRTALARGEEKRNHVRLRLAALEPERDELDADLQRLASVRSELVALAAHSDEAYAKLRPHDRQVAELVQRKDDLDAMILQLQGEQADIDSALSKDHEAMQRQEELRVDEIARADAAALAVEIEERLTRIAYGLRYGGSFRDWTFVRNSLDKLIFPPDPARLPREKREAIRHAMTGGLVGTPAAQ